MKKFRKFVRLPNGKKDSASFTRKTDAEVWFQRRKLEVKRMKAYGTEVVAPTKFVDHAESWMRNVESVNQPKTIAEYRSILNRHLNPKFGNLKLSDLNRSDGEDLVQSLVAEKLSPKTISKIFGVLKSILKNAYMNGLLAREPFLGVKIPKPKAKRMHFLTLAEVNQLLEAAKDSNIYGIVFLTVNTGLRLGEVLGLCWDCIDLNRGRMTIARSADRFGIKEHTKNGRHRELPISPPVVEFLKSERKLNPFQGRVFLNDGAIWNPDHFKERYFDKVVEKSGIRKCRFHDLRHTFATHYMHNGGSLFDLQKFLGHQRIENTMVYAHNSIEHLSKSATIVQFGPKPILENEEEIFRNELIAMPQ